MKTERQSNGSVVLTIGREELKELLDVLRPIQAEYALDSTSETVHPEGIKRAGQLLLLVRALGDTPWRHPES